MQGIGQGFNLSGHIFLGSENLPPLLDYCIVGKGRPIAYYMPTTEVISRILICSLSLQRVYPGLKSQSKDR